MMEYEAGLVKMTDLLFNFLTTYFFNVRKLGNHWLIEIGGEWNT